MATAAVGLPDISLAPDFIRFLFSTKPKFDCYFKVGNESQGKPERIGGVKLMLMAHSEVFRLELEESELKEKEEFPIKDIHPDTFRGMLKYVYGHDTTKDMCFDEADNLLYVAEKYLMKTLKDKLALRLMDLLNPDNICSLLNNPACHTHLELNSAITEILRYETDRVLESQQFLWMNADGFLKILEQDGLAVTEIELWRAAIKWAKHRAQSEDGRMLRQQLSTLTPHLRLCTLTESEIFEVIPTGVLSIEEVGAVCLSIGKNENPQGLREISNEIVPRERLTAGMRPVNERSSHMRRPRKLELSKLTHMSILSKWSYKFNIHTKKDSVTLLPLVCQSRDRDEQGIKKFKIDCTTTITRVVNPDNSADEPPVTVTFSGNVDSGEVLEIPLAVEGRDITLLPNSEYRVEMKLDGDHKRYCSHDRGSGSYGDDHLTLDITPHGGFYLFPSDQLQYRVPTTAE